MGLVMGTFSLQSKPVTYHKGKKLYFTLMENSPNSLRMNACERKHVADNVRAAPVMICVCASAVVSCVFAVTVMNIAQELHLCE